MKSGLWVDHQWMDGFEKGEAPTHLTKLLGALSISLIHVLTNYHWDDFLLWLMHFTSFGG